MEFTTGKAITWIAETQCPWQLALCASNRVYISGNSLADYTAICPTCNCGSVLSWSANGSALYTLNSHRRLQQVDFSGSSKEFIHPNEITPQNWESPFLWPARLWPAPDGTNLYCLAVSDYDARISFWRLATRTRKASLLLPRTTLSVDYCAVSNSMLCYHTDSPGVVALNDLENGVVDERRITGNEIISARFSGTGRLLVFSESDDGIHVFKCNDLETGETINLGCATYGSCAPSEELVAAVRADQELLLFNRVSGETHSIVRIEDFHTERTLPYSIPVVPEWSPDGRWVAFCLWVWKGDVPIVQAKQAEPKFYPSGLATLVFDVAERTLFRIPLDSQCFAWRPRAG